VTARTVLCGIFVLSIVGEANTFAQEQAPQSQLPQSQPSSVLPVPDATRRQVEGFERILRGSIEAAAVKLNTRLGEAIPNVQFQLQFQAQPVVTGIVMPDDNAVFHVLIPAIEQTGVRIIDAYVAMQQRGAAGTRVSGTGNLVVDPDPAAPPAAVRFDPNTEYTKFARQALIDALLDHGMSVQISPEKTLTIVADELLPQNSPFLQRSRSLILQISGADLLALKENRLARDDAKGRIKEFRY
jgi:hypothetical protein